MDKTNGSSGHSQPATLVSCVNQAFVEFSTDHQNYLCVPKTLSFTRSC